MILNSKLKTKPKNCVMNSNFKRKKHASKSCSKLKNHNAICHPSPTMPFHIWSQLVLKSSNIKTFYLVIPLQSFCSTLSSRLNLNLIDLGWQLWEVGRGEGRGWRVLYPRLVLPTKILPQTLTLYYRLGIFRISFRYKILPWTLGLY